MQNLKNIILQVVGTIIFVYLAVFLIMLLLGDPNYTIAKLQSSDDVFTVVYLLVIFNFLWIAIVTNNYDLVRTSIVAMFLYYGNILIELILIISYVIYLIK